MIGTRLRALLVVACCFGALYLVQSAGLHDLLPAARFVALTAGTLSIVLAGVYYAVLYSGRADA